MKKKTTVLRAEDFKYPSKGERKEAENSYPNLFNFGFEYKHSFESILNGDKSFYEIGKEASLYWWDICLLNKFGNLNIAYINTYVNHKRDWLENGEAPELQFKFYSETFYYFLFSARDIMFQILNIFYDLNIKEYDVSAKNLKKKLTDDCVLEMILKLETGLKEASEIRNSFTHRFPKNQKDYRMTHTKEEKSEVLSAGSGREMKPAEIVENINNSLLFMETWVNQLREYLNRKPRR